MEPEGRSTMAAGILADGKRKMEYLISVNDGLTSQNSQQGVG